MYRPVDRLKTGIRVLCRIERNLFSQGISMGLFQGTRSTTRARGQVSGVFVVILVLCRFFGGGSMGTRVASQDEVGGSRPKARGFQSAHKTKRLLVNVLYSRRNSP